MLHRFLPLVLAGPALAPAAEPLTLAGAVRAALDRHPSIAAASARTEAAAARVDQSHAGLMPRLTYTESAAGSNNPVFVFGSLLTQHQFSEKNFAIDKLNRPDFLSNFQSLAALDQTLYDGGQTKARIRAAEAGRSAAVEGERTARMAALAGVVRAYLGAVLAGESAHAATEAIRSAESDLARAEAVRAAGMSTDADVLSIRVHLAAAREQKIARQAELSAARAALNEAMGVALGEEYELTTPLAAPPADAAPVETLEVEAVKQRPETRQAGLGVEAAESQLAEAKAARLPQVSARAAFEADRQRFITRAGANWYFGGTLRWNVFDGNAAKARIAEASSQTRAAEAQRRQMEQGVRLEVRRAYAGRIAAGERVTVAQAAVTQAEESLRILKNRYEAGLTTVTELLRAETALLEARMRQLAAVHDLRLSAIALEFSTGALSGNSPALQ